MSACASIVFSRPASKIETGFSGLSCVRCKMQIDAGAAELGDWIWEGGFANGEELVDEVCMQFQENIDICWSQIQCLSVLDRQSWAVFPLVCAGFALGSVAMRNGICQWQRSKGIWKPGNQQTPGLNGRELARQCQDCQLCTDGSVVERRNAKTEM